MKIQHAYHGRHEVKDLQEVDECAKIPMNNKTNTHETNLEPPKKIIDKSKVAQNN